MDDVRRRRVEILIFLQFVYSYLEHSKASSPNFPKLEHLYLRDCHRLREIPIDFAEISTLKSIKLEKCLPSAVESAKKIEDEQREYGNNDMVVIEDNEHRMFWNLRKA
ncbi:PREDICTED: putative late blight resistance protein homolog R1B-12 [Ipomoea nil]|uniref:putative late blight resistance protein homolog R1B-12 n=1 Tax=Ipomoea nil TaxID=35883 RepID=UPI000900B4D0|nr:PREDICTED: putative late blight resistance protein homolog R1B-12 [Ipomoea nil]